VLTVAGELPAVDETELFTLEIEEEGTELDPRTITVIGKFLPRGAGVCNLHTS
jgi:hypothetical protein